MSSVRTPPTESNSRAAWGLEQLPPEPLEWQPRPPLLTRLLRATSAPIITSIAVFLVVIIVTAATVFSLPRTPVSAVADDSLEGVHTTAGADFGASDSHEAAALPDFGEQQPQDLFVHVVGEVIRPGVVQLEPGARVAAAIEAAGGATPAAVLAGVNLARPISDGEQIVVPDSEMVAAGGNAATGMAGAPAAMGGDGRINVNLADATTLESLPRVGPALASRIIDWREANGGFDSVEQLLEVSGIGQRTFEGLSAQVTV